MREILQIHQKIKDEIEKRLEEFKEGNIIEELIFCLLTPQSKAEKCWNAVLKLKNSGLLIKGKEEEILKKLNGIRFKYKKARYIVEARKKLPILEKILNSPPHEAREWLVKNIKGMGYKEASHFLRNIGKGEDFAILDRHILRNLKKFGIIDEIPKSLNRRKYTEIEKKMKEFSEKIGIPLSHLDLLLWYKETGKVFK